MKEVPTEELQVNQMIHSSRESKVHYIFIRELIAVGRLKIESSSNQVKNVTSHWREYLQRR